MASTKPKRTKSQSRADKGVPKELTGLPERLRYAMSNAGGIKADTLESLAGVGKGSVSRILKSERLTRISAVKLVQLARTLGVTSGWLIANEPPVFPAASSGQAPLVLLEESDKG